MNTRNIITNNKQQFQEDEYFLPYHWSIEHATKKGAVYFGYWNLALTYAGNCTGKDILDAGCGDGFFTSLVTAKNPRSVVGIDYSKRAISFARLLLPNVEFHVENLATLSFPNDSFDIIFLIEVLEHIPNTERRRISKELSRVLRDNGKLIVSSPSVLMPVLEKHEQHFSEATFQTVLAPYFMTDQVLGQDRVGYVRMIYLFLFRIAKNRFWTLHYGVQILTAVYRRFLNEAPLHYARRFVGVFKKSL